MSESFLADLHRHRRTSEVDLETLTRDLTGLTVQETTHISQGYANEVYVASTREHRDVVIRIQDRGVVSFADEASVMERGRLAGVPIPRVFGVTSLDDVQGSRDVMVIEKAPGRPLADVMDTLDTQQMTTLFSRIGAALATMHGIHVDQFGPAGSGSIGTWTSYARELLDARRAEACDAIEAGLTRNEVDSLLRIIERMEDITCEAPSLCHGDISADHLFVDETLNLTAIIDFGMCQGGPGALDIAILTMFHPDVRLEWLWSGYAPGEHVPANYPRHILTLQANVALTYLAHDFRLGNADSRPIVLAGLRLIIEQWHSSAP